MFGALNMSKRRTGKSSSESDVFHDRAFTSKFFCVRINVCRSTPGTATTASFAMGEKSHAVD